MFYINDERLTKNEFPDEWKLYQQGMQEIKERKHIPKGEKIYVFNDPTPTKFDSKMRKEPKKNIDFKTQEDHNGVRWNLCKSSTIDNNGNRVYDPTWLRFNERERLNPDNVFEREKIFFYLYISKVAQHRFVLRNLEQEAKDRNEAESLERDVNFMVKSPYSPLSVETTGSEETLRYVAAAWGVQRSDILTIERLKQAIVDAVTNSNNRYDDTKRGFTEFLSEMSDLPGLKVRADIQLATEKGLIDYVEDRWIYKKTGKVICRVPASLYSNPILALINKLAFPRDREDFNEILYENRIDNTIDSNVEEVKPVEEYQVLAKRENKDTSEKYKNLTSDELNKLHITELKRLYKELGGELRRTTKGPEMKNYIMEQVSLL